MTSTAKTFATVTLSSPALGGASYWELETLFTPPSNVAGQLCTLVPRIVNVTHKTKATKVLEAYSTYFLTLDVGQPYNSSSINVANSVDLTNSRMNVTSGGGTGIISSTMLFLISAPAGTVTTGQTVTGTGVQNNTTISSGSGTIYVVSPSQNTPAATGSGNMTITAGTGAMNFPTAPAGTINVGDYVFGATVTAGTVVTAKTDSQNYTVSPANAASLQTVTTYAPSALVNFTTYTAVPLSGIQTYTQSSIIATLVTDEAGNIINLTNQPKSLIRVPHSPENVRLVLQPTNMSSTLPDLAAFTVVFELIPVL